MWKIVLAELMYACVYFKEPNISDISYAQYKIINNIFKSLKLHIQKQSLKLSLLINFKLFCATSQLVLDVFSSAHKTMVVWQHIATMHKVQNSCRKLLSKLLAVGQSNSESFTTTIVEIVVFTIMNIYYHNRGFVENIHS